ncbi:MAG TPA: FtsX-like permease family protein [Steroidobacteraceae bacterium]|nr:FtsX-like permease family protein [Steroidobacteraceae bacterium]
MSQILAIVAMNLRNLPARASASWVAVLGFAGVVLVLIAVLAMAEGFGKTLEGVGADDVAIVLRGGSGDEMSSSLMPDAVNVVINAPGVLSEGGQPFVAAELFVTLDLPKRSSGTFANVPFRGTNELGPKLRSKFQIASGRMFTPGRDEVIVGLGAARTFLGLELGGKLKTGTATWEIVGIFSDGGSVMESEIWTDARVLQGAYNRGSTFQSVRVKLASAGDFATFRDSLTTDKRVNVSARTERAFMAAQSETLSTVIRTAGFAIGFLMGVGAVFGALNTMYSAVSSRAREIATLQALGFGTAPILISVLTEALLLALAGGVLGGVVAFAAFNGFEASTLNYQSFTQVSFAFAVTPALMGSGIVYALALGLIGGLLPAIRAVRLPIVDGLRAI